MLDDLSQAIPVEYHHATNHVSYCLSNYRFESTHILDNVTMVANEQVGATVLQVDLHANQTIRMTWQMM
jgi:hypothetical protein